VSTQRLSLTRNGRIRYQLKTPYNDGTTHVIFEPLDFIARLARSRLTFFGCFPTFTNDRSTAAKAPSMNAGSGLGHTAVIQIA
jgi:hypothetical protein